MRYLITFVLVLLSYCSYGQIVGTQVLAFKGNITSTIRDGLDVPTGEFWLIYNSTTSQLEQSGDDDVWTEFSGAGIVAADIDTYAELNAIVADVTLTHNGLFDTFAELDAIVADKSLVNLEDANIFANSQNSFQSQLKIIGQVTNEFANINLLAPDGVTLNAQVSYSKGLTFPGMLIKNSNAGAADNLILKDAGGADYDGVFSANSFVKDGATSDDVLLGDGTTTSLAGLGGADNLGNHTATTSLDMAQNPINNILSAEWVYSTGANEVTTGFSAGNAVFHLAAPNDASQALRYNFTTGDWFFPYDNTTSGLTADDLWEAVDELAAGAGDTSLSNTNQTVPTGTTRTVNAAGTATIGFQQDGVEVARVGGDNDDVFQVLALEALTGNVISSNSGIGLPEIDTGVVAASDYTGSLVKDTGSVFFSNGTIWIELGSGATISDTGFGISWDGVTTIGASKNAIYDEMIKKVNSDVTGEPTGSDAITNMVSLTKAEYDAGTPVAGTFYVVTNATTPEVIQIACSDLTTNITTGTSKAYFRMPWAATLTDVRVSLLTAGTATGITVDINESGTTVLSTKLTTDATEATSETATTAAVISDSALADDAIITIDFDAVPTAGKGVIVTLYVEY